MLIFWVAIAALSISRYRLFTFWQVDADGIRYRRLWVTRKIPFTNIVAVREKDYSTGEPLNELRSKYPAVGQTSIRTSTSSPNPRTAKPSSKPWKPSLPRPSSKASTFCITSADSRQQAG